MNPLVSIIVPVYNVEKYLEKCITSILKQTYLNLEVILVDDGSSDASPALCDDYEKKDSRVKVIHKLNGGLSSARNSGLDICNGDYICFIDSDDWIHPDTIRNCIEVFEIKEIDIVCIAGQKVSENGFVEKCFSYYSSGTILDSKQVVKKILLDEIGSQAVQGIYRSSCWKAVRFPLNQLYEDIPTVYRAFNNARKIYFIDEMFYFYRVNMNSISYSSNPRKNYHIFLGFLDHYYFSKNNYPAISGKCCAIAAHYALTTLCRNWNKSTIDSEIEKEIMSFLDSNKKTILKNLDAMPVSRRIVMIAYYNMRKLLKILCKVYREV